MVIAIQKKREMSIFLLILLIFQGLALNILLSNFSNYLKINSIYGNIQKQNIQNLVKTASNSGYTFVWNRTVKGNSDFLDMGEGVAVDSNGNVYVVGELSQINTSLDIILIKYDSLGNLIWNRTISSNGSNADYGKEIVIDNDNNIYIVGRIYNGATNIDLILVKYDSNGILIWNKTWGKSNLEYGNDICIANNYLYITGYTNSWGSGLDDIIIVKFDLNGNLLWNYTWGGSDIDQGNGIVVDQNDIFIIGISFNGFDYDTVILRLLDIGTSASLVYIKYWGGPNNDEGYDIGMDSDKGLYITGYTESFGLGKEEVFLLKYNISGQNIWNRTWGGSETDKSFGLTIDTNNNIFIVGYTESNRIEIYFDFFILQYDVNGNQPWSAIWHGGRYHEGYGIITHGNALYATGYVQYIGGVDRQITLLCYVQSQQPNITTTSIPGFQISNIIIPLMLIIAIFLKPCKKLNKKQFFNKSIN
ncbi:MAG: SBBP repeat-containing protein [Candidatus Helarchaeota archaeon]